MKIDRVRAYHTRTELGPAEAFSFSPAHVGARTAMLVEIVADDGRSGWGEAYGPPAPSKGLGLEVDRALLERYAVTAGETTR